MVERDVDIEIVPGVECLAAVLALVHETVRKVGFNVLDEVPLLKADLPTEAAAVGSRVLII
jgi:hypothetical protein